MPRDIATRAIHRIVYQEKLGINGQAAVYLDVTHIPRETLDRKLEGILEIYEKFLGVDPRDEPMKVFPAMHYTMGGIWVNDEDQATNVPGIYAAGECEYQYHGANRLGANSLVSCIFGGGIAGPAAVKYARSLEKGTDVHRFHGVSSANRSARKRKNQALIAQDGTENPITIWKELGEIMTEHVTVTRINKNLEGAYAKLGELQARYRKINLSDRTRWSNQTLNFARELENMLILARVITIGALLSQRIPRRALQARFPGTRRRQLAEDHARKVGQRRHPADLRAGRYFADSAAPASLRRGEISRLGPWPRRNKSSCASSAKPARKRPRAGKSLRCRGVRR